MFLWQTILNYFEIEYYSERIVCRNGTPYSSIMSVIIVNYVTQENV